ncbi:MAG: biotin--[acetyl-CoA-carboxylase] ligase [Desulfobacterales bacterium]|jgi:BirA family biotin operon repressor/biotin-[acetyl-CoA-carboxylase] ligase|nr:biotin--[acetyl-CoA-carboxylase] ligase [Desulfobacterales bacterium]
MPDGRAIILNFARAGFFDAIDPDRLAACGPQWNLDAKRFSSWKMISQHKLNPKTGDVIFESDVIKMDHSVVICGSCTSSMDVAWLFISEENFKVWDSILAVEQTAGRGQHQRIWMSPAGNIHAAWRLPHPSSTKDLDDRWLNFASLIAGYLLARIISEKYGLPVRIKWPNDLLVNNKKIGGILTEARNGQLVVGIGINLAFSPESSQLRNDFAVSATNLRDEGINSTPLSLWMEIAEKGRRYFDQLTGSVSPDEFINALKLYLAWVGEKVLVKIVDQDPFEAVISGISSQGGLVVKTDTSEKVVYAGSIIPA